jgi:hypothetical protein
VSLRFVSHSKEEVATDVQERVHGTASGGCTSKVGDHEAGMEAQSSCFVVSLKKKQDMADKLLSLLAQKMADVFIALRQFWSRRVFFGTQALPKNRGAYVDNQNWHSTIPTGLTGTP